METKSLFLSLLAALGNLIPLNGAGDKVEIPCDSVVAYFAGTFQDPENPQNSFEAAFQVRFSFDYEYYLATIEYWNNTLLNDKEVFLSLDTKDTWRHCFLFDQPCKIPRSEYSEWLMLSAFVSYPSYSFRLVQFESPEGWRFKLKNTFNGCTSELPQPTDKLEGGVLPDFKLFRSCGCCGLYKPDESLNCPVNPLQ